MHMDSGLSVPGSRIRSKSISLLVLHYKNATALVTACNRSYTSIWKASVIQMSEPDAAMARILEVSARLRTISILPYPN